METENSSSVPDEAFLSILVLILVAIAGKYLLEKVIPQILREANIFWENYNLWVFGSFGLILLCLLAYFVYSFIIEYGKELEAKVRKELLFEERKDNLKTLLELTQDVEDREEIENAIESITGTIKRNRNIVGLDAEVSSLYFRLLNLKRKLPLVEKRKEIDELDDLKRSLEYEIKDLEKEKYKRKAALENDRNYILKKLKADEKNVFKMKGRTKKEIAALKKEGYKVVNEYCVYEQKVVPALVKKVSNHTLVHVFLVWSVARLLNSIEGISKVREYLSVNADLTFEFLEKKYAIEVERGSLAKKPKQRAQKKAYLKRRFGKRWFVVLSHRDLKKKYKDFGIIATRKEVRKVLGEMLKLEIF